MANKEQWEGKEKNEKKGEKEVKEEKDHNFNSRQANQDGKLVLVILYLNCLESLVEQGKNNFLLARTCDKLQIRNSYCEEEKKITKLSSDS